MPYYYGSQVIDLTKVTAGDWIAFYAAVLSTIIGLVAAVRYIHGRLRANKERGKFQTDLYFLKKTDRTTKQVFPIVVVLAANLGSGRISLKSLEYDGVVGTAGKTSGMLGWYEQPEELFGIRNRLLPKVLESGQTADFPMIEIGVITRMTNLRIWFTDFDDKRHYIANEDIEKVRIDIRNLYPDVAADHHAM